MIRYEAQKKKNDCCVRENKVHRSCWCEIKGDWNNKNNLMCQDLCMADEGCRGYGRYGDLHKKRLKQCSLATTSECPKGCYGPVNNENVGSLNLTAKCSSHLRKEDINEGCVLKQKGV